MRYLAWIAIFSLQMGMFVCGAGIDVCHAADKTTHMEASQSDGGSDNAMIDSTCAAHAAHVFLALPMPSQGLFDYDTLSEGTPLSLSFFDIQHLIEHPPRSLHS